MILKQFVSHYTCTQLSESAPGQSIDLCAADTPLYGTSVTSSIKYWWLRLPQYSLHPGQEFGLINPIIAWTRFLVGNNSLLIWCQGAVSVVILIIINKLPDTQSCNNDTSWLRQSSSGRRMNVKSYFSPHLMERVRRQLYVDHFVHLSDSFIHRRKYCKIQQWL